MIIGLEALKLSITWKLTFVKPKLDGGSGSSVNTLRNRITRNYVADFAGTSANPFKFNFKATGQQSTTNCTNQNSLGTVCNLLNIASRYIFKNKGVALIAYDLYNRYRRYIIIYQK